MYILGRLSTLIAILLLSSCSAIKFDVIPSTYTEGFNTLRNSIYGNNDSLITREVVDNIPYASMLLSLGNNSNSLIILENKIGSKYTWVSSNSISIVMESGRVVRTFGLPNNLSAFSSPANTFKNILNRDKPLLDYVTYYSYDNPTLLDLRVEVKTKVGEETSISILGELKQVVLVQQDISNNQINWNRSNKFWVDKENFYVWKSEQYISPKLPKFTIQTTKKPAI